MTVFPIILYHKGYGAETFGNQDDVDWAIEHGWIDHPDGMKGPFKISTQPYSIIMQKVRNFHDSMEPSEMDMATLRAECKKRAINSFGKTKEVLTEMIKDYDNGTNTD